MLANNSWLYFKIMAQLSSAKDAFEHTVSDPEQLKDM